MSDYAIEAQNISKTIDNRSILSDLSFKIPTNSITLIYGINGSGKSITIKILCKLINSKYNLLLIKGRTAYVPDKFPNDINLTLNEYFQFLRMTYKDNFNEEFLNVLLQNFSLKKFLSYRINQCSQGTIQKVNLIQCLMTNADILIFDEPFNGLDDKSVQFLIQLFNRLKESKTIILTSHETHLHSQFVTDVLDIKTGEVSKFNSTFGEENKNIMTVTIVNDKNLNIDQILTDVSHSIDYQQNKSNIKISKSLLNRALQLLINHEVEILEVKGGKE